MFRSEKLLICPIISRITAPGKRVGRARLAAIECFNSSIASVAASSLFAWVPSNRSIVGLLDIMTDLFWPNS